MKWLQQKCKKISSDPQFQGFIIGLIVMTAIVMGLETSSFLGGYYSEWFDVFYIVVQFLFCAEIAVRMFAFAPDIRKFFDQGWNRFDFAVVAVSLLPVAGPFALIARFARILRVARLVSTSQHLKEFIVKITDAADIMIQAGIVAGVFYYIYAIAGFHLFGVTDAEHWGSFGAALVTLTKLATFQNYNEIADGLGGNLLAWVYAGSFVFLNIVLFVNFIAATTLDHILDHEKRSSGGKR